MILFLLRLFFLLLPAISQADALADFKYFIAHSHALSARFTQIVIEKNGRKSSPATGKLLIARPGKFHWHYEKPFPNQIIGNGQKVWLYDEELKQVVVKNASEVIDSSPAALLAGNDDFEQYYHVKTEGEKEGIAWLQAKPKDLNSHFQSIRLALKNKIIDRIELIDQFNQTTLITFQQVLLNPKLTKNQFTFIPPKGIDIISE